MGYVRDFGQNGILLGIEKAPTARELDRRAEEVAALFLLIHERN